MCVCVCVCVCVCTWVEVLLLEQLCEWSVDELHDARPDARPPEPVAPTREVVLKLPDRLVDALPRNALDVDRLRGK